VALRVSWQGGSAPLTPRTLDSVFAENHDFDRCCSGGVVVVLRA
jgi:hypothetical protein